MTDVTQDNSPALAGCSVLTSSEVAALFRVSRTTVSKWAKTGKLVSVSPGTQLRFREDEVRAILNGGRS